MRTKLLELPTTIEFSDDERAGLLNKLWLYTNDKAKYPLSPEEMQRAERATKENGHIQKMLTHVSASVLLNKHTVRCCVKDLAEDIKNQNDLNNPNEIMLADQMAAVHHAAMIMLSQIYKEDGISIELTDKYINMSTKLMKTFQNGMLALHQVKNAGKQTITVKHQNVQVNQLNGGQAIIADEIHTGGGDND